MVPQRIRYSPTAYNVYKAYTIRSEYQSDGTCVKVTNPPSTLSVAFTEAIPEASGAVYFDAGGQQNFLEFLSLTGCSAGGENLTPIVVAQVQNTTAEITRYQSGPALSPASRTLGRVSCPQFYPDRVPIAHSLMKPGCFHQLLPLST